MKVGSMQWRCDRCVACVECLGKIDVETVMLESGVVRGQTKSVGINEYVRTPRRNIPSCVDASYGFLAVVIKNEDGPRAADPRPISRTLLSPCGNTLSILSIGWRAARTTCIIYGDDMSPGTYVYLRSAVLHLGHVSVILRGEEWPSSRAKWTAALLRRTRRLDVACNVVGVRSFEPQNDVTPM
ncbi:hypothetical protein EVAR_66618_1 [Eumeta japonica]|uniref:Uncharacterized protein n=1 Tax=Eumeta variegata TaxID=151549 RepID=A0A4C2A456_EUMVA|nr:hypothetical protein EVAR_66618_1 [Eumeta japonica]